VTSPCSCLSVCVFQLIDFLELQHGDRATEGDRDALLFYRSFDHSKMADVRTPEADAKVASVNVEP
jgi:hypothetical protein